MKIAGAICSAIIAFVLAAVLLFPNLMPTNPAIPAFQPIEKQNSFGRHEWLDAMAMESALDASLLQYGEFQFHNRYLGGGLLLIGDPRDTSLSPLTWLTLPLPPLSRTKVKMLLMMLAAYLAVIGLVRRQFGFSWLGGIEIGLLFLVMLRTWPSLIEYPMDAGLLLALPGLALLWVNPGRIRYAGLAALFLALACIGIGPGIFAVVLAVLIVGLSQALNPPEARPTNPIRYALIALGLAMVFGAVKLLPMSETIHMLRAFWANPVDPTVRVSPFHYLTVAPTPYLIKTLCAAFFLSFWVMLGKAGKAGAIATAAFTVLCLLPDWGTASGGWLAASEMIAPIDSPARYFFPFLAFFAAVSLAAGASWFNNSVSGKILFARLMLPLIVVMMIPVAIHFKELKWETPEKPFDLSSTREAGSLEPFYQVRTPPNRKRVPRAESVHPAMLIPQNVGVVDPAMLYRPYIYTPSKYLLRRVPPRLERGRRYKGEFFTSTTKIQVLEVEDHANQVDIKLKVDGQGHFVLNRRWDLNWKLVSEAGEMVPFRGKVSVQFKEPGSYAFTLKYSPFSFWLGLVISLGSILLFVLFTLPWDRLRSPEQ